MEQVEGAVAVVTGAASGIGRGLATSPLERGAAAMVLADEAWDRFAGRPPRFQVYE